MVVVALNQEVAMAETKWYNAFEDTNTHADPFVADKVDLDRSSQWDLREGRRLPGLSKDVTFWTDNEDWDGVPDDVLQHCVIELPVYSQPLRQALEDAGISGIQYLPVRIRRPNGGLIEGYSIANIMNLLPALDDGKSLLSRYGESRPDRVGEIRSIMKPVLTKSVLGGYDIFRLAEYPLRYFVSSRFRDVFVSGKFTGYSFREVPLS